MFKTVGIYKSMNSPRDFEKFYISEFMPRMLQLPGVIEMKISKLTPTQLPNQDSDLQEINLIVETYYESADTLKQLMTTEEGQKIASLLVSQGQEKVGAFVAQEYKVQNVRQLKENHDC